VVNLGGSLGCSSPVGAIRRKEGRNNKRKAEGQFLKDKNIPSRLSTARNMARSVSTLWIQFTRRLKADELLDENIKKGKEA